MKIITKILALVLTVSAAMFTFQPLALANTPHILQQDWQEKIQQEIQEEETKNEVTVSATGIDVRILAGKDVFWQGTVNADGCIIKDDVGIDHVLIGPKAICALDMASQIGGFSYVIQDTAWGLYLKSIDGYNTDATSFWLYRVNFISPFVGLADYDLADNDELLLNFGPWPGTPLRIQTDKTSVETGEEFNLQVDFYDDASGTWQGQNAAKVSAGGTEWVTDASGSFKATWPTTGKIDVFAYLDTHARSDTISIDVNAKVLPPLAPITADQLLAAANLGAQFLINNQLTNGLIENQGISAWAAIALAANGINPDTVINGRSLLDAMADYQDPQNTTDYARHIKALVAAGQDPRDFVGRNWIDGLLGYYDGSQFGDRALINDDVFALLALVASNELGDTQLVNNALAHILSKQTAGGGFGYDGGAADVDTTGATIQLLVELKQKGFIINSKIIDDAVDYLRSIQNKDGGFPYWAGQTSNAASTAWAVQAIIAYGEDPATWQQDRQATPYHYILDLQGASGGFIWQNPGSEANLMTAYVLPALRSAAWPIIGDKSWYREIIGGSTSDILAADPSLASGASVVEEIVKLARPIDDTAREVRSSPAPVSVGEVLGQMQQMIPSLVSGIARAGIKSGNWQRSQLIYILTILAAVAAYAVARIVLKERLRRQQHRT